MADIVTLTSLSVDAQIQVIVRAHNSKGWSDYSEENTSGSTIETVPATMTTLTFDKTTSTNTDIYLTWTAVPDGIESGGSAISVSSYTVEQFTSSWVTLGTTAAATYTVSSLTGGTTYLFRISATNVHGTSTASSSLSIVAG